MIGVNVTMAQVKIDELFDVTRTTGKAGKCERMDSPRCPSRLFSVVSSIRSLGHSP